MGLGLALSFAFKAGGKADRVCGPLDEDDKPVAVLDPCASAHACKRSQSSWNSKKSRESFPELMLARLIDDLTCMLVGKQYIIVYVHW